MARSTLLTRLGDRAARTLWSGDVIESDVTVADTADTYRRNGGWSRTEAGVSKQDTGLRRGTVPEHIESPIKGRPRSYNPLSLRKLAKSGEVQINLGAILGDLEHVPWSVVPVDESTSVSQSVIDEATRALEDPNPNPESFDDINSMLARDLLEVGNCATVVNLHVDGRRAEAIPLDPNTFTAEWDRHRILQRFFQYPRANQRWGTPEEFDRELVMWGVFQPTITRAGIYGYSPVEVVSRFINIMGGLVDKEVAELEEGMPSGLITLIGDEWNGNDYEKFKDYWREEVKGEQIKHPVAQGEADFVPFNMTYKELQVLDRQKWYSKLVAAAFRTPVSETGLAIGEEMTRATDVSQRQKYKQRALGAVLNQLEQLWTYQYLHRWFSEDIRLKFDPGRDLMEKREIAETNQTRLQNGTTTINEIRRERGEEPVEWGDEPFDITAYTRARLGDANADGRLSSVERENQNALDEGLQQNQTPTQDGGDTDFSDTAVVAGKPFAGFEDWDDCIQTLTGRGHSAEEAEKICGKLQSEHEDDAGASKSMGYDTAEGYWLPADAEVVSMKALRESDDWRQFSFQPGEIEALQEDLETLYRDAIESVLNKLRENQQLLREPTVDQPGKSPKDVAAQKNVPAMMQLVKAELGIGFAEDIRDVVVEHKSEKVTEGEQDILTELSQAGLAVEDVDLEPVRDRVVESIRERTMQIVRPISARLESDLREVFETAWTEGHSVTEVESDIEDLSDDWTGYEAERLARDQLGKAAKEGRIEYAEATGPEVGGWSRTWIATGGRDGDGRTRDSHKRMHGKTVGPGESWTVNYAPDGGPPAVDEKFPGASVWGIQCRCSFSLSPVGLSKSVNDWAENPTPRMEEAAEEQGRPIDRVMLGAELGNESRTAAHKRLGVSRPTYYKWLKDSGLYDR